MCVACVEYQKGLLTIDEWLTNASELSCDDSWIDIALDEPPPKP